MRHTRLALGLATACLLAAPAAGATPVFDAFRSLCIANPGGGSEALKSADAAGWMPIPDSLLKRGFGEFTDAQGRMKSDAQGLYLMLVGQMKQKIDKVDMKLKVCAVAATSPADAVAFRAEIGSFAAVPMDHKLSSRREDVYVFTEENGVHTVIENPDANVGDVLLAKRQPKFVFLRVDKEMAMVALAVPET